MNFGTLRHLPLAIVAAVLVSASSAMARAAGCEDSVTDSVQLSDAEKAILLKARSRFLTEILVPASTYIHTPDFIPYNGQQLKPLYFLGHGGEGTVYVVKTEAGEERVAKIFTYSVQFKKSLADFAMARDAGYPVPEIVGSDPDSRVMLMEHRKGLTVEVVMHYSDRIGIPWQLEKKITDRYQALFEIHRNSSVTHYLEFNVIIVPESGRFVLIDPH